MTDKLPLNLSGFKFTAKVDYVTLKGLKKGPLPALDGKAKWPRSAPGNLTVHDATIADIQTLADTFPSTFVKELEICVDIRTAKSLTAELQHEVLQAFKAEFVAKRLMPSFIADTNSGFRGAYDHFLGKTLPYNYRVPRPHQQLLMGHRKDEVQVKCYYKQIDQGKPLSLEKHSIRVEVRMSTKGLKHHGLVIVEDLLGFKFRKELMPYFTHVSGSRLPKARKSSRKALLDVMYEKLSDFDLPHWQRIGVGAFLNGGKRRKVNHIFKRDIELNNRIGQALGRLERSFSVKKFVRFGTLSNE